MVASRDCVTNAEGREYLGRTKSSKSGKLCKNWSEIVNKNEMFYNFIEGNDNLAAIENYCRNPTGRSTGPWCFVSENLDWESCGIKLCGSFNIAFIMKVIHSTTYLAECRSGWTKCKSGKSCIKKEWLCDGSVQCEDGSDEREACSQYMRMN